MKNKNYQTACESNVSTSYFPEYEQTGINTSDEGCVEESNEFVMYW